MYKKIGAIILSLLIVGCSEQTPADKSSVDMADMIIENGNLYSLSWDEPSREGEPAENAPYAYDRWSPDAEAIAIKDGLILAVGTTAEMAQYKGENTEVIDAGGNYIFPGFHDAHTHTEELGATFDDVNLNGVQTEEEAVQRVVDRMKENNPPKGQWIVARGWDEGYWANRLPTHHLMTEMAPDNPVLLDGAKGFAAWGNKLAMEAAGITNDAEDPVGGEFVRDENGNVTGAVRNRGVAVYRGAVPPLTEERWKKRLVDGMTELAKSGFTMLHHAGVNTPVMDAYQSLNEEGKMIVRTSAMISGRDKPQMEQWKKTGPINYDSNMLFVNSVKGYYDGSLGIRGAKMIEEYSDMPGHHGVSGEDYGFFVKEIGEMVQAGFQVNVHAIGDGGSREILDFYEGHFKINPELQKNRHRVEHAQIVHPDDFKRYAELDIIASVQPPFVAEDPPWTEERIGPDRVAGAFAWRTFRRHGVPLAFGADLMGYDWNIFYGLHSAITRRSRELVPAEGWRPEENLTPEEAIRGYTTGAAYASFVEDKAGTLEAGKWADITVVDIDILNVGHEKPEDLFHGNILMTVVGGNIVYQK